MLDHLRDEDTAQGLFVPSLEPIEEIRVNSVEATRQTFAHVGIVYLDPDRVNACVTEQLEKFATSAAQVRHRSWCPFKAPHVGPHPFGDFLRTAAKGSLVRAVVLVAHPLP